MAVMSERKCGTCSACCRWPSVPDIGKPARTPCQYLAKQGYGCVAYEHRPEACASYRCSWLRGIGAKEDQPVRCHVLIDRRMTQFGHVLVAKPLRPGAAMSRKGKAAIQRATHAEGLPCLIVDYEDTEQVIGAAGPKDFIAEVESKEVNGEIRLGNTSGWIENIISAGLQGRIMPGLPIEPSSSEGESDGR